MAKKTPKQKTVKCEKCGKENHHMSHYCKGTKKDGSPCENQLWTDADIKKINDKREATRAATKAAKDAEQAAEEAAQNQPVFTLKAMKERAEAIRKQVEEVEPLIAELKMLDAAIAAMEG